MERLPFYHDKDDVLDAISLSDVDVRKLKELMEGAYYTISFTT